MSKKSYNNKLNHNRKLKMNRSRSVNRHNHFRIINRKLNILCALYGSDYTYDYYDKSKKGKLSKGKIHCSCYMCSLKSRDYLKVSDIKKLESIKFALNEYNNEDYEILN